MYLFRLFFQGEMKKGMIFFGIGMIAIGIYSVVRRDTYAKRGNAIWMFAAFELNEKMQKRIIAAMGILVILIGVVVLASAIVALVNEKRYV